MQLRFSGRAECILGLHIRPPRDMMKEPEKNKRRYIMKRRILAVLLALAVVLALALPALAAVSADTVPYNTGTR